MTSQRIERSPDERESGDPGQNPNCHQKPAAANVAIQRQKEDEAPHSGSAECGSDGNHQKQDHKTHRLVALELCLTFGILAATAAQAFFMNRQLGVMQAQIDGQSDSFEKQLNEMASQTAQARVAAEAAKATAEATKSAADEATKANASAQRNARMQLRAYMIPVPVQTLAFNTATREFVATIPFRNVGQTPAHNVVIRADLIYKPTTYSGPFDVFKIAPQGGVAMTFGPGNEWGITVTKKISETDLKTGRNGKMAAWVFGEIAFTDAFDQRWIYTFRLRQGEASAEAKNYYALTVESDGNSERPDNSAQQSRVPK